VRRVGIQKQLHLINQNQRSSQQLEDEMRLLRFKEESIILRLEDMYRKELSTKKLLRAAHSVDKGELARDWLQDTVPGESELVQMTLHSLLKNIKGQT
jgi:hypothetical protein